MTPIRYGGPPPPAPFFSLAFGPWIRLEREPQGRVRWFEPGDEGRLLEACGRAGLGTHRALQTGLRLEGTKSGRCGRFRCPRPSTTC